MLLYAFPVLLGFFGAVSGGVPDDLTHTLDALHAGGDLPFPGRAALFPLMLLQNTGLRLR